jgi:DNA gyrase subunit A
MISEDDRKNSQILLISKEGQTIKMTFKWIRKTSRVTQWVILTKLKKPWDKIVRATIVREDENIEEK